MLNSNHMSNRKFRLDRICLPILTEVRTVITLSDIPKIECYFIRSLKLNCLEFYYLYNLRFVDKIKGNTLLMTAAIKQNKTLNQNAEATKIKIHMMTPISKSIKFMNSANKIN